MVIRARRGFTLLELLVVITLIVILASLLLVGLGSLGEKERRARTDHIMTTVKTALQGAETSTAPVSHPLAGHALIAGSRPLYVGNRSGSIGPLDATQRAIDADEAAIAGGLANRLILPDDRLAEAGLVHLFGLPRHQLRILGIASPLTEGVYRVPVHLRGATADTNLQWETPSLIRFEFGGSNEIDLSTTLSDQSQDEWEQLADRAISASLGDEIERITNEGGLLRPTTADALAFGDRVRLDQDSERATDIGSDSEWAPGRVLDPDDNTWKPVLIRGPALYDAWGGEILIDYQQGTWRLQSAGRDGAFVIHPGDNKTLDTTDPFATEPSSDDRWADRDNRIIGGD